MTNEEAEAFFKQGQHTLWFITPAYFVEQVQALATQGDLTDDGPLITLRVIGPPGMWPYVGYLEQDFWLTREQAYQNAIEAADAIATFYTEAAQRLKEEK